MSDSTETQSIRKLSLARLVSESPTSSNIEIPHRTTTALVDRNQELNRFLAALSPGGSNFTGGTLQEIEFRLVDGARRLVNLQPQISPKTSSSLPTPFFRLEALGGVFGLNQFLAEIVVENGLARCSNCTTVVDHSPLEFEIEAIRELKIGSVALTASLSSLGEGAQSTTLFELIEFHGINFIVIDGHLVSVHTFQNDQANLSRMTPQGVVDSIGDFELVLSSWGLPFTKESERELKKATDNNGVFQLSLVLLNKNRSVKSKSSLKTNLQCHKCGSDVPPLNYQLFASAEQFESCQKCRSLGCFCELCGGTGLAQTEVEVSIFDKSLEDLRRVSCEELLDWLSSNDIPSSSHVRNAVQILSLFGFKSYQLWSNTAEFSYGESLRLQLALVASIGGSDSIVVTDGVMSSMPAAEINNLLESLKKVTTQGETVICTGLREDQLRLFENLANLSCDQDLMPLKKFNIPKIKKTLTKRTKIFLQNPNSKLWSEFASSISLGVITVIAGDSGSGKTLFLEALKSQFPTRSSKAKRVNREDLRSVLLSAPRKVTSPISTIASECGIYQEIVKIFVALPRARILGVDTKDFSLASSPLLCGDCAGLGFRHLESSSSYAFECESCKGMRFGRKALSISFRGSSIGEVLKMPLSEALDFFEKQSVLRQTLELLVEIGLGSYCLGTTLNNLPFSVVRRLHLVNLITSSVFVAERDVKRQRLPEIVLLDEPLAGISGKMLELGFQLFSEAASAGRAVILSSNDPAVMELSDEVLYSNRVNEEGMCSRFSISTVKLK